MLPLLDSVFGNPSSVHRKGQEARAILDTARERVAHVGRCKATEIVFTSGATESINLAIFGVARRFRSRGRHIITSSLEHHAVLHACDYLARTEGFEITHLPVDPSGAVSLEHLDAAIRSDTVLVSVMAANNEIGTVQPVTEIGRLCRARGVLFHTDAVQWFGKQPFPSMASFEADLVSLCGHKFHGPKGAGALFIRSPLIIDPLLFGGAHENERRAGTENLAAVVGLAEAMELFVSDPVFLRGDVARLCDELVALIDGLEGVHFRGSRFNRLPNTVAFTVEGCESLPLLASLDLEGVCASSGSACTSGSLQNSHVLRALGVRDSIGFLRFSLGRENTQAEVDQVKQLLPAVIQRIRQRPI